MTASYEVRRSKSIDDFHALCMIDVVLSTDMLKITGPITSLDHCQCCTRVDVTCLSFTLLIQSGSSGVTGLMIRHHSMVPVSANALAVLGLYAITKGLF